MRTTRPIIFSSVAGTALLASVAAAIVAEPLSDAKPVTVATGSAVDAGADGDALVLDAELASVDRRFTPTTRPDSPRAVRPDASTTQNTDANKPFAEWQHATDDWFGVRPRLDDRGITFQGSLAAEFSKNMRGGLDTAGTDFRHLLNVNLTLDTERLFGLKGGTAYVNFQTQNGQAADSAGDVQGFSNIDADGRTQLSEIWYEQKLLDGAARLKAGKIDANTEFAFAENAGEFLNSSMGFSPTILGLPTYPDPSFGVVAFAYPTESFYAGVGVFDGSAQEGVATGSRGPATLFGGPTDLFVIGEVGLKWALSEGRNGRVGVGGWRHTGSFDRTDGGVEHGTQGYYVVLDQTLWHFDSKNPDDARGIGAYLQYGHADQAVSDVSDHVGLGLTCTGLVPGRQDDVLGAGVSWVNLNDTFADNETTVELFYKVQVTPFISVKPDLQYITNPGGDGTTDDAIVALVRVVIDF